MLSAEESDAGVFVSAAAAIDVMFHTKRGKGFWDEGFFEILFSFVLRFLVIENCKTTNSIPTLPCSP